MKRSQWEQEEVSYDELRGYLSYAYRMFETMSTEACKDRYIRKSHGGSDYEVAVRGVRDDAWFGFYGSRRQAKKITFPKCVHQAALVARSPSSAARS